MDGGINELSQLAFEFYSIRALNLSPDFLAKTNT